MEPIDLAEKIAGESLKELRAAYDALHERAYKFATLASAAAGALAAYALSRVGNSDWQWQTLPIGLLSLWLFGVAGYALWFGASTKDMLAGATAASVKARLRKHVSDQAIADAGDDEGARLAEHRIHLTRWDLATSIDTQIAGYAAGVAARGKVVDRSYKLAILGAPACLLLGALAAWRLS